MPEKGGFQAQGYGFLWGRAPKGLFSGTGVASIFPRGHKGIVSDFPVIRKIRKVQSRTILKVSPEEGSDRCCNGVLLLTQEMILALDQLQGAARIYLMILLGI